MTVELHPLKVTILRQLNSIHEKKNHKVFLTGVSDSFLSLSLDSVSFWHSFWIPNGSWKCPIKWVFLPFCPSILPSAQTFFLRLYHWFFPNFGMALETNMKLCVTAGFSGKNFLLPKLGKWIKNGPKTGFFEFMEKFSY